MEQCVLHTLEDESYQTILLKEMPTEVHVHIRAAGSTLWWKNRDQVNIILWRKTAEELISSIPATCV